jgi:hypothetical protein
MKGTIYFYSEYVENYVFSYETRNLRSSTREQRWKSFLDNESIGQKIKACIKKQNPTWSDNQAAIEISGIYRFVSLGVHSTANEIFNDKRNLNNEVKLLEKNAKILSVLSCIASVIVLSKLPILEA